MKIPLDELVKQSEKAIAHSPGRMRVLWCGSSLLIAARSDSKGHRARKSTKPASAYLLGSSSVCFALTHALSSIGYNAAHRLPRTSSRVPKGIRGYPKH